MSFYNGSLCTQVTLIYPASNSSVECYFKMLLKEVACWATIYWYTTMITAHEPEFEEIPAAFEVNK